MKLVLFGASKGGENYIANHPEADVVAFADNDVSKHGAHFLGRPIIAPTDLMSYAVDKVVITSQWVDQIYSQLKNQIGLPANKIEIPSKQAVKAALPFEDPTTLSFAESLVRTLNQFCRANDISMCLDSGTLLGAIRNSGFIPWDDDIDLALDKGNFIKLQLVLPELTQVLSEKFDVHWRIVVITVNGVDACINIEFTNTTNTHFVLFDVSIQRRESINGYSELLSSGGLFFAPAKHFERYESVDFLGQRFNVPFESRDFLTFMYGQWSTPKKTTQITDYENRRASIAAPIDGITVKKRIVNHDGLNAS